jgi:internalin A
MGTNLESRRRLLAIIRSNMERIHSEIKNLIPDEIVPLPGLPKHLVLYKDLEVMEQNGITELDKVVGNEVLKFEIRKLLNGVDLPKVEIKEKEISDRNPIAVFISYAHKDESFKKALEPHLTILQRQNVIRVWNDRDILPGEKFGKEINQSLEKADIILLLVSANFVASDYCYEKEMKRALERHEKKEAVVIPIIIRECDWRDAPFGEIQALPKDGKAVSSWSNKDKAWTNISEGIKKIAIDLRQSPNK